MSYVSFHGNPAAKKALLETLRKHKELDAFIHHTYGMRMDGVGEFKGCAVGCTIYSSKSDFPYTHLHSEYPVRYGIPESLAWVEDNIFERLNRKKDYSVWPINFIKAMPVGVDLSNVINRMRVLGLKDAKARKRLDDAFGEGAGTFFRQHTGSLDAPEVVDFLREKGWPPSSSPPYTSNRRVLVVMVGAAGAPAFSILRDTHAALRLQKLYFAAMRELPRANKLLPLDVRYRSFKNGAPIRVWPSSAEKTFKRIPSRYRPFDLRTFRKLENAADAAGGTP